MDGWSILLLLQEALVLYRGLSQGHETTLQPARPYRDYIAWLLRQDLTPAEAFCVSLFAEGVGLAPSCAEPLVLDDGGWDSYGAQA